MHFYVLYLCMFVLMITDGMSGRLLDNSIKKIFDASIVSLQVNTVCWVFITLITLFIKLVALIFFFRVSLTVFSV